MSETHAALVALWRSAAAATKEAQRKLDATFEAYIRGDGPPPGQQQIDDLRVLQEIEYKRLQRAMDYVARVTKGHPSEPGALG